MNRFTANDAKEAADRYLDSTGALAVAMSFIYNRVKEQAQVGNRHVKIKTGEITDHLKQHSEINLSTRALMVAVNSQLHRDGYYTVMGYDRIVVNGDEGEFPFITVKWD